MDINTQDWEIKVIRKNKLPKIPQPPTPHKPETTSEDVPKPKIVTHEMAQFITQARVTQKLKQHELAKKACLEHKIIAEIERGGCIYNATNINKIAKALGVNIPRKKN